MKRVLVILRVLAMGGALLLPLASCELLFVGAFPSSVGQATARADLSASIGAGPASYFSLTTLTAGGVEYVLLFSDLTFDSSKAHLVVMDPHLNVLQTFTNDQLFSMVATFLTGKTAMTDANDKVAIGNLLFDPLSTGLSNPTGNPSIVLSGPSTGLQPFDAFNETNYQAGGGLLQWDEYNIAWLGHIPYNAPLGTPNPPPQSTIRIVHVFNDQSSLASPVVYVFRDDGSERTYFLRIPRIDLRNDLNPTVIPPAEGVLGHYAAVVKDHLSSESIGFSRQGIIAYDQQNSALVHFTLDAPDKVDSLSLSRIDHLQLVAGISGSYCFVWDPARRVLTRYEQWWQ